MKVAVVSHSPVPFRRGGAERLFGGLSRALEAAGHATELIKLPTRELLLSDLIESYAGFAALDLTHFDLVISGRYPAWMIEHPHHVVWMLHPMRGLYDSYPAGAFVDTRLPDTPGVDAVLEQLDRPVTDADPMTLIHATLAHAAEVGPTDPTLAIPGPMARGVVQRLDRIALDRRRVRRHAAISATVAGRADYFPPDVEPVVLHPPVAFPLDDPGPIGDTFVAVSRLERVKRIDLVIEAFRHAPDAARLVIAGEGPDHDRLAELAAADDRIELVGRVDDNGLRQLYRDARAVIVCPRDEDYGYIAAEAMAAGRAVITTRDAGGPTELVIDGASGLVAEPRPDSLAASIGRLATDPELATRLGATARGRIEPIRWGHIVDTLLAPRRAGRRVGAGGRPRLVALSTYPVHPQRSGGPLRAAHLLRAVCADGEIEAEIVSTTPIGNSVERHRLSEHITETVVPLSPRHLAAETDLRLVTGPVSITDVAAGLMWRATPTLARELAGALEDAAGAVLVQPYLAPALHELAPELPSVCDCHNHERAMKSGMYPSNEGGSWLMGKVLEIERAAVRGAALVTATTEADLASVVSEYDVARDRAAVVPNGVDCSEIEFVTGDERWSRRAALLGELGLHPSTRVLALFVGSGHGPNIDAGRTLVHRAPELSQVEFLLVGRHSEELHHSKLPPNVRLLGAVDDVTLERLLSAADVALNPIRTGGGSNLKLLTYLAAGLPVITSSVGARGIDAATAGVLVANLDRLGDAIEWIESDRGRERALAGRRYVEEHADWRSIGANFRELIDKYVLT